MGYLRSILLRSGVAFLGIVSPAAACELAIVLAVDISGSVDQGEFRVQMDGLAEALRDPLVADALVGLEAHAMVLQWTGTSRQRTSVPWTALDSLVAVETLAQQIETAPRIWRNFSTAIGEAISVSMTHFDAVEDCRRRVIDISGDGPSNEGVIPETLRAQLALREITVNAVAIEETVTGLTEYYKLEVIFGPGAFVERAATFEDYPAAIRRKLMREVVEVYGALRP